MTELYNQLVQQYATIIGVAATTSLITSLVVIFIFCKKTKNRGANSSPQVEAPTASHSYQDSATSGEATQGGVVAYPTQSPAPPKHISQADLEKQKLDLITSFPELDIIMSNLDKFKVLLGTQKLDVPETITPIEILTARRISDMLYKHQKILLGTSRLTKERLFAATINLLKKS